MDIFKFTCYAWYFFTMWAITMILMNYRNIDENNKFIRKWQVVVVFAVVPTSMSYFLFFKEGMATMLGIGMIAFIMYCDMTAPRRRR